MSLIRILFLIPVAALLSGCAGMNIDELNATRAKGSPFTVALTKEYREFVNSEAAQYDWVDAGHFATKGLRAAKGENVPPERLADWSLPGQKINEMEKYRYRLAGLLDGGARKAHPQTAAEAQAKFDCWVEQQEENWQPQDIAACRKEFLQAFNALQDKMPELASRLEKDAGSKIAKSDVALQSEDGMIYFTFNSARLDASARRTVKSMAHAISKNNLTTVIGYADRAGSEGYNLSLSRKRALAVKNALIQEGVAAKSVRIEAMGEENLAVATADGVREARNRRVQIIMNNDKLF